MVGKRPTDPGRSLNRTLVLGPFSWLFLSTLQSNRGSLVLNRFCGLGSTLDVETDRVATTRSSCGRVRASLHRVRRPPDQVGWVLAVVPAAAGAVVRVGAATSLHRLRETHGLRPSAAVERRLDTVETIGQAVVGKISGASIRDVAAELDLPATTVRDWLRRHRERAFELERGLICWAIEMGEEAPCDRPRDVEPAAVTALGMAWHAACRRWSGRPGGVWRFWSAITGGRALATNRRPPFAQR